MSQDESLVVQVRVTDKRNGERSRTRERSHGRGMCSPRIE